MNVLDLFSGIGGFSLGLERAGMRTVAFCEQDEFCQAVLAQHWPGVPIYDDVRTLTADTLRRDGIAVDAICGGFPCQDLSFAGKRTGLEGARSGLWSEYARLIGELRPRFVIVENVPGLLSLGMGAVLGDLAALGYDAVWDCVPASAVGAPHRRDRVWIIAHAKHDGSSRSEVTGIIRTGKESGRVQQSKGLGAIQDVAHANGQGEHDGAEHAEVGGSPELVADAGSQRDEPHREPRELHGARRSPQGEGHQRERRRRAADGGGADVADTHEQRCAQPIRAGQEVSRTGPSEPAGPHGGGWHPWEFEPDVGRVADGVPARVDRLRSLGNAVVPQIPYLIGRAIMQAESP